MIDRHSVADRVGGAIGNRPNGRVLMRHVRWRQLELGVSRFVDS
jgi:hypothetical protein